MHLDKAIEIGLKIVGTLHSPSVKAQVVGSTRRLKKNPRDVDILVAGMDCINIALKIARIFPDAVKTGNGTTALKFRIDSEPVDIYVTTKRSWGAAMNHYTGPKARNVVIRSIAKKKGITVNEKGYFRNNKRVGGGGKEEQLYKLLGLKYVPATGRDEPVHRRKEVSK